MPPAICCDDLGKCYRVSDDAGGMYRYRTLREELVRWLTAPFRGGAGRGREFWALRHVGFEVQQGEVVGVIGRNGAGKSTLLKILSRVTRPTAGEAELRGRVGSLLEVGTGFHPELTGRENIQLSGAVLGMKRHEIARKFDRIVEFAEVGAFLDTPVKRYSSGMHVRLAFAVAAHLEPEILLVDEVLAVGDLGFQRKCLARMREVGRSGCTVLFVSHSMPAVESLCGRVLLLDGGRVAGDGPVGDLVREYHRRVIQPAEAPRVPLADRDGPGRRVKVFRSAALLDERGEPTRWLRLGGTFRLRVELGPPQPLDGATVTVGIDDTLGHRLLSVLTPRTRPVLDRLAAAAVLECRVPNFPLAPGEYWVKLGLDCAGVELDQVERVLHFTVLDGDAFGEGRGFHRGLCVAASEWEQVPAG
jgi:lipopolysaccharide transport system ATP-binding protein